jgi:hypothetical protein
MTSPLRNTVFPWLALLLPPLLILAGANAIVARLNLPLYGTFTGLRPLEEKLESYRAVTDRGLADCVLLGSSLTESGCAVTEVNAQLEKHGDTRRFYNLAEGGAHLQTQLAVYRMARQIHQPKEVAVGILTMGTDSDYYVDSDELPMRAMKKAPVGRYLHSDTQLRLASLAWRQPLLRDAVPLRDLLLEGSFRNRLFDYTDHHGRNEYGDLVSHVVCLDAAGAQLQAMQQRERLLAMWANAGSPEEFLKREWPARLAILRELKSRVSKDQARLILFPVLTAYMAVHEDREMLNIANTIVQALSKELQCEAVLFPAVSGLRPHEMLDAAHFNRSGAEVLGTRLGAALAGANQPQRSPADFPAAADYPNARETEWGGFTSVIVHPEKAGDCVEVVFRQGWNIPVWEHERPIEAVVCLPGGRRARVPVETFAPSMVRVRFHGWMKGTRDSALLISFVNARTGHAIEVPIQEYRWVSVPNASIESSQPAAN